MGHEKKIHAGRKDGDLIRRGGPEGVGEGEERKAGMVTMKVHYVHV